MRLRLFKLKVNHQLNSYYQRRSSTKSLSNETNVFQDVPMINLKKPEYSSSAFSNFKILKRTSISSYPAVTVILGETRSKNAELALKQWEKNLIFEMGIVNFEEFRRNQLLSGSILRKIILKKLKGAPEERLNIPTELEGYWKSLSNIFSVLSKVILTEQIVVHPNLRYKGMIDCIAEFRSKTMLVCWKKSDKLKTTLDMTFDTPLQIAAYIGAVNFDENCPFRIEEALLVMSYSDGSRADVFHINKDKCISYWKQWLTRLHIYRNTNIANSKNESIGEEIHSTPLKDTVKSLEQSEVIIQTLKEADTVTNRSSMDGKCTPELTDFEKSLHYGFPLYNNEKQKYTENEAYNLSAVKESTFDSLSSYPAVTAVLRESLSESAKFALNRWKQNMIMQLGIDGFERYSNDLLESGRRFHKLIHNYLLGSSEENLSVPADLEGPWKSVKPVFSLLSDVKLTESNVVHEVLQYKGIVDCIAVFRDKPVIIDWKKSDKVKNSIDMTYDAPLQIAAYIGAINYDKNYPFKIDEALLVMTYVNGTKADVFHLNKEKCLHYWNLWLQRLHKYKKKLKENDLRISY